MRKHLLFFVLLVNCRTFVQPRKNDGIQGLKSAGHARVNPEQKPRMFDGSVRMVSEQGSSLQQIPLRLSNMDQSSQGSGGISESFSGENLGKKTQKRFDIIRSLLNGMCVCRQKVGGRKRRPSQFNKSKSNGRKGDGDSNKGRLRQDPTAEKIEFIYESDEIRDHIHMLLAKRGPRNKFQPYTFHQECLDAHNYYRALHGVPPLTLNPQMSQISQRWAEHLANRGVVKGIYHSDRSFRQGYGENIHAGSGFIETGRTPVDSWYDGIKNYDFKTGTSINGKKIGPLTALLWKTSEELGVGYAFSAEGAIFVVCHYNPDGNFMGRTRRNVPPVGGFTEEDLREQAEEDEKRRQVN